MKTKMLYTDIRTTTNKEDHEGTFTLVSDKCAVEITGYLYISTITKEELLISDTEIKNLGVVEKSVDFELYSNVFHIKKILSQTFDNATITTEYAEIDMFQFDRLVHGNKVYNVYVYEYESSGSNLFLRATEICK